MTLVVDASVALKWLVAEDDADMARALRSTPRELEAPRLMLGELCNAAWKLWRRGSLTSDQVSIIARAAPLAFAKLHPIGPLAPRASEMALSLDHPAYDCFYLALAERERTVVVTADRRLVAKVSQTRWAGLVRLLGS